MSTVSDEPPPVNPGDATKERTDVIEWNDASRHYPCLKCEATKWCSSADVEGGQLIGCRHKGDPTDPHFLRTKTDASGQLIHLYRIPDGEAVRTRDGSPTPRPVVEPADRDLFHRAYTALVEALELSAEHQADLLRRGLSEGPIAAGRYRSMPPADRRHRIVDAVRERAGLSFAELAKIPGFVRDEHGFRLHGNAGLMIPVVDAGGRIAGIQIRLDRPIVINGKVEGKYLWLSTPQGGPRIAAAAHVPPHGDGQQDLLRLTEGPLKAAIATAQGDLLTIGVPGVFTWNRALEALESLGVKTVRLAFDADYLTNQNVARALVAAYRGLKAKGYSVEVERWKPDAGKGIDDVLVAGGTTEVLSGDDAERFIEGIPTGRLPRIVVTHKLHEVVAGAVRALAQDEEVHQRGSLLVRMVRNVRPPRGMRDTEGTPQIHAIPVPRLLELMSRCAEWVRRGEDKGGKPTLVPTSPTEKFAKMVADRCDWPGIRPLEGVIEAPTIRPDGSILQRPGYDPDSGLFFLPNARFPVIPETPTQEEARRAIDRMLRFVADFPFGASADCYAWLAACLTAAARFAVAGPCPMFLFDSNVAGSGKTKLCDVIAIIVSGRTMPRSSYSQHDDETRKQLLSIALGGFPFVLFDNLQTGDSLGGSALDRALTSTLINDRLLGQSKMSGDVPFHAVLYATGNNLGLKGDALRRVVPCRLESPMERPEERDDFTIPGDLLNHVRENRPALVVAALTVVRAYIVAGRPKCNLTPMDYPAWSGVIRNAIHWASGIDPCATRKGKIADDEATTELAGLIRGWEALCTSPEAKKRGLTAAGALEALEASNGVHADLRALLCEWTKDGKLPSSRIIGNRLKKIRGRPSGEKDHEKAMDFSILDGNRYWFVRIAKRPSESGFGGSSDSEHTPHAESLDDEDSQDVSGTGEKQSHYSHYNHLLNGIANGNGAQPHSPDSPDSPEDGDREVFTI